MGKPTGRNGPVLPDEHIVWVEGTWGTETSKYPEEEKEKSIPQVAASETGIAQTSTLSSRAKREKGKEKREKVLHFTLLTLAHGVSVLGLRTRHMELQNFALAEQSGKIGHRR
jgi:hypothetical protein